MSAQPEVSVKDWLTPDQLAEEWDVPVKWVRSQMAAWPNGGIPNVQIGKRRWFTPACRQVLEDRVLQGQPAPSPAAAALAALPAPTDGWGQVTRESTTAAARARGPRLVGPP